MIPVFLDSTPENFVPGLTLEAEHLLTEHWNGWVRPVATASAFQALLMGWRANDPNGTWGEAVVAGDILVYTPSDDEDPTDEFPAAGSDPNGDALFDFTGWTWILARS